MTTSTRDQEHEERDWWVPLFRGAWLVIAGAAALFAAEDSRPLLMLLFATSALIAGGVLLTDGVALRARFAIFQGVISLAAGLTLLAMPLQPDVRQAIVIGVWAIVMGGVDVTVAARNLMRRGQAALLTAGSVSIIGGMVAVLGVWFRPLLTLPTFGGFAILTGLALMGSGVAQRPRARRVPTVPAGAAAPS